MSQMEMPTGAKRSHRNHDFVDLFPRGVFPTGEVDILEHGGNVLLIKSCEYGRALTEKQVGIFKLLVRFGEQDSAPGSITTVCVWGLGATPREWQVFDHMGVSPVQRGTIDDWRTWLRDWWKWSRRR